MTQLPATSPHTPPKLVSIPYTPLATCWIMSTKRKHRTSTGGERPSSRSAPSKTEEEKVEPEPKKSKKDPTHTVTPPTREGGGTLGGLPLFGEKLADQGYSAIPAAAKIACNKLSDVMSHVKELKSDGTKGTEEMTAQQKAGTLLFAQLRRLNRLSNLYCKDTREKTQEKKLGVDELHLQLQNLQYEAKHLQKEIRSCLQFKSKHEDIDLISVEEFYDTAPEGITKPEITQIDSHKLMLARLEWELKQREQLASRQSTLEVSIKSKEEETQKLDEKLSSLRPSLERLQTATLPLQEFFDMPLDWQRDQYHLATLMPTPLYTIYVQADGYSKAQDSLLKVVIEGDLEEAKSFVAARQQEQGVQENSDSDQEAESTTKKKKKRGKKANSSEEEPLFRKSFPLSVSLIITTKGVGSVTVVFQYLPFFNAICSLLTTIQLESNHDNQKALFIDKSALLHNLFEGDSGKTSPNAAVSAQIRKYGGDNFSAAVRQYGFPYKWVQQACGVVVLSEDSTEIKLDNDVSTKSIQEVIKVIRYRMRSQLNLMKQLSLLEQLKLPVFGDEGKEDEIAHSSLSQLTRWKSVTLQEVQNSQFGGLAIFNLQERANRFFLATFQHGQARFHSIICLTPDYPRTKPLLAVLVELSERQREPYNMQLKNIEAEVNIHYPLSLPADKYGEKLLLAQLNRLQFLVDMYIQCQVSSAPGNKLSPRGKARLLSVVN